MIREIGILVPLGMDEPIFLTDECTYFFYEINI